MKVFVLALLIGLAVAQTSCEDKIDFSPSSDTYTFSLAALPYPYTFLETVLTSQMLYAHHDHHHQTYYDKLNSYLSGVANLQDQTLVELNLGATEDKSLQKFAGGAYNHNLYWWILTSPDCAKTQPEGVLYDAIVSAFGSFDNFKSLFEQSSIGVFGSGWSWLCVNQSKTLEIRNTANQINPLMNIDGSICYPFFTNDIWEHAYYLKYMWDRPTYISNYWNIVDWNIVEYFYETYANNLQAVPL